MGRTDLRIWIVDDDLGFGRSLKRLLSAKGIPAEFFGSAQSFLDSVPPGRPGLAIVDIHMPGCDGFELIRKMRAQGYDMPVIVITGHANSQASELAMKNGALAYLQKPFSEESLMEIVRKQEPGQPTR